MRLKRLAVRNFRNLRDIDIPLEPGTVIVGENRSGKSNLLHAVRLVLDASLPNSDRYLSPEDFSEELSDGDLDPMAEGEVIEVIIDDDWLRRQGLIDFDGLVTAAVNLVERHAFVRRTLLARYHRIFIDEYQDLAPGLDRLVRALCFDHRARTDLFAVGDPDQAIYGWTGTKPELLDELAARSDVTTVRLNINYRCAEEIMGLPRRALVGDREIRRVRRGGHAEARYCPGGFANQITTATDAVIAAARGVPLHEIAVLCVTNEECNRVARALRNRDIEVIVRGADYESTRVTALLERAAAWATMNHERSGQRLGDLLREWRWTLDEVWSRTVGVQFTQHLIGAAATAASSARAFIDGLMALGLAPALELRAQSEERRGVDSLLAALGNGPLRGLTVRGFGRRA